MKNTLINLGLTAGAVYVLYILLKKDDVIPKNKPLPPEYLPQPSGDEIFSNFLGFMKKRKKVKNNSGSQRTVGTKCASNLERLGMLFPNDNQYNAELGKAYEKYGANFNAWAMADAKPCFVVGGTEQGGLQSGGINFDGSPQEIIANEKKAREARLKNKRPIVVPTVKNVLGKTQRGFQKEGLNFTASDFSFQGAGDF